MKSLQLFISGSGKFLLVYNDFVCLKTSSALCFKSDNPQLGNEVTSNPERNDSVRIEKVKN